MKLTRFVLLAAAAAGATYWFNARGPGNRFAAPRLRLEMGGGLGAAAATATPVAETMWTPADPAAASTATGSPASSG